MFTIVVKILIYIEQNQNNSQMFKADKSTHRHIIGIVMPLYWVYYHDRAFGISGDIPIRFHSRVSDPWSCSGYKVGACSQKTQKATKPEK